MHSKVAIDTVCQFLRVPLEIRLSIYSYLLLEPPGASLDSRHHERAFDAMMDQDEDVEE